MKTPPQSSLRNFSIALAVASVSVFNIQSAFAGNTWDGGGTDTNWGTAVNWDLNTLPSYGTLTFAGSTRPTNVNNLFTSANVVTVGAGTLSMNGLNFNTSTAFTISGNQIDFFDNGGTQAKIENNGAGLATINLATRFANTNSTNPWAEINAVSGNINFGSTGTLGITGTQVGGIRFYGSGRTVTINSAISESNNFAATGSTKRYLAIMGTNNVTLGATNSYTGDTYVMNGGTLTLSSAGVINTTSAIRLGGDFGTTGGQNLALGGTLTLSNAAGGQTVANLINTVGSNTSSSLQINSQNTSLTNTISGAIVLDSDLAINQSSGGTLSITNAALNLKGQTLTLVGGSTGNIGITSVIGNSTGSGQLVVGTNGTASSAGTVTLSNGNTYSGDTFVRAGTLAFTSAGSAANSVIRLGSTSGTSVNANVNLTTLAGGTTLSNTINAVATTGTGTKTISSLNTSNTNTLSGQIALDSDLTISQAALGTLSITQARTGGAGTTTGLDVKTNTLTLNAASTGIINITGDVYNSTGSGVGNILVSGAGTYSLGGSQDNVSVAVTANAGTLTLAKASSASIHAIGSGLTIGGGTVNLGGAGGDQIFNSTGVTVNSGTFGVNTLNETVGAVTLAGGSITGSTGVLTGSSYDVRAGSISAILGGTAALTKSTAGTVTVTGMNTYTGATTIDAGILNVSTVANVNTASGIGSGSAGGSAADLVFGGGTLQYNTAATATTNRLFTIGDANGLTATLDSSAAAGANSLNFNGAGAIAFGGSGARSLTLTGSASASVFNPILGNGTGGSTSLIKSGSGTWFVTGANTYSGNTSIQQGILSVSSIGNTGSTSSNLGGSSTTIDIGSLANSGTLTYTGSGENTDRVINLAGTTGGATIGSTSVGLLKFTSNVTATGVGAKTLTFTNTGAGGIEMSGTIGDSTSGATSIAKNNAVTLFLSNTNNSFTGGITLNQGIIDAKTLSTSGNSSLGSGSAGIAVATGSGGNAILRISGAGGTTNRSITITRSGAGSNGAILDSSGTGAVNFAGAITAGSSAAVSTTSFNLLTLQGTFTGADNIVSGAITDNNITALNERLTAVTKANATAVWVLSGTGSNYTGATTNSGGTLAGIGANAFGNTSGISIAGSGVLSLRGDSDTQFAKATGGLYSITTTASGATINADQATGAGTLAKTMAIGTLGTTSTATPYQLNFTGANNTSLSVGAVTGAANATVSATSAIATISNAITGGGSLTLASYTSANLNTTGGENLIFSGSGNTTVTGAITPSANPLRLTQSGTGTLTLNGTSSYTGINTITSGVVEAAVLANGNSNSSIGASSNAAANLVFGDPTATLRYTGSANVTIDRGFTTSSTAGGGATIESSGTGTLSLDNTIGIAYQTTNQTRSLTLGGSNTGANTFSKVIANNGTGATSLTKAGAGTWVLDAVNTYTGSTTIGTSAAGASLQNSQTANGGTLIAGAVDTLKSTTAITINNGGTLLLATAGIIDRVNNSATITLGTTGGTGVGGTISIANLAGAQETFGALTLASNSIIDFGTGGTSGSKNLLTFSSINATSLNSFVLSVYNWSGTNVTGAGADELFFGNAGALTGSQLNNIQFYSDSGSSFVGNGTTIALGTNEIVPVPEPSTWVGAGLITSLAAWSQRKRLNIRKLLANA